MNKDWLLSIIKKRPQMVLSIIVMSTALMPHSAEATTSESSFASPKLEHLGLSVGREYIDGPAMEAAGVNHKQMGVDSEGNIFFVAVIETNKKTMIATLRCLGTNGMVRTIAGEDWFLPYTNSEEGPAGLLPTRLGGAETSHRTGGVYITIKGLPLEGEDQGCIYVPLRGYPCKVYKNKKKNGRWWFKVLGKGTQPLPTTVGESVLFNEANLRGIRLRKNTIMINKCLYSWNGDDGTITCLLTPAVYENKALNLKTGKPLKVENISMSDDGTFYAQYYGRIPGGGLGGRIFRISKDLSTVKEIVRCVKGGKDGPGLKTGYHCGPVNLEPAYKDILLITSQDSNCVRRWKDGRVSTLCMDGEWRETYNGGGRGSPQVKAKRWKYVPGGDYIYFRYPGEETGAMTGIWRFGPVDFLKATIATTTGDK